MNLFFLHGMGGSPADWVEVKNHLPGEALSLPAGLSFEETTAALAEQLRTETKPFVLCGYSMGGRLAIRVASKLRGSRLAGLALVSTGLGFSSEEERAARLATDARWADLARQNSASFWEKWYAQELFLSFRALPVTRRSSWLENRFSLNIEHLEQQFRSLSPGAHDHLLSELEALPKLGISVLYIVGEQDKKYLQLAQKVNVPVEVLEGGHILPLENPGALATSLRRFTEKSAEGRNHGKKY